MQTHEGKTIQIHLRISEERYHVLQEMAKARERSLAQLLRDIIATHLNNPDSRLLLSGLLLLISGLI